MCVHVCVHILPVSRGANRLQSAFLSSTRKCVKDGGKVDWERQQATDKKQEIKKWRDKKIASEEEGEKHRGRCPLIVISIVGICICIHLLPKMQMGLTANLSKSLVGTLYLCGCVCVFLLTPCYLSSSLVLSQQRGVDGGSAPGRSTVTPVRVMDGGRDGLTDGWTD